MSKILFRLAVADLVGSVQWHFPFAGVVGLFATKAAALLVARETYQQQKLTIRGETDKSGTVFETLMYILACDPCLHDQICERALVGRSTYNMHVLSLPHMEH